METPAHSKPPKAKTHPGIPLVLGVLLVMGKVGRGESPHRVVTLTWQVLNEEGDPVWAVSGNHPLETWWPELTPDLCMLALHGRDYWGLQNHPPHSSPPGPPCCTSSGSQAKGCARDCNEPLTSITPRCNTAWNRMKLGQAMQAGFYVCPGLHRPRWSRSCGGPNDYYCAKWGCETTGQAYWKPSSSWDYITVSIEKFNSGICKNNSWCNPLVIRFTPSGKTANSWTSGYYWGLRLYRSGHPGLNFGIRLQVTKAPSQLLGPNLVLADQRPPSRPVPVAPPIPPLYNSTGAPSGTTDVTSTSSDGQLQWPGTGDRLINLVRGAYLTLNLTSPDRTQECWLCLVSEPPYYEGIAVPGGYINFTTAPSNCSSLPQHKLTLSEVTGQGQCIGTVPSSHQALCNQTEAVAAGSYYLVAPKGTLWACNTGLTPCLSASVLNVTKDYCILVEVWPKITYHSSSDLYAQFEQRARFKREPVSLTLALLLGGLTVGGMAAGIGTGVVALTTTQQFMQLQKAMNTDLQALEASITNLEKSLTSLSEVVLQNRRGLDLLFLKEGGLCAALKEECCFYADHTGLVRDSMAKLRERLRQRQKMFDSQQGWFEGLFNKSPWFTTLISTIIGPLIILLLILSFAPCILNRLTQLIKERVSMVQALVLTQQYHQLKNIDPEEAESKE